MRTAMLLAIRAQWQRHACVGSYGRRQSLARDVVTHVEFVACDHARAAGKRDSGRESPASNTGSG